MVMVVDEEEESISVSNSKHNKMQFEIGMRDVQYKIRSTAESCSLIRRTTTLYSIIAILQFTEDASAKCNTSVSLQGIGIFRPLVLRTQAIIYT